MRRRSLLSKFTTLVLCGLLAGVAVAAAVFPANAIVALAAKSASDAFLDLPSELKTPPPPQTSYVYANDGKTLITTFYDVNRQDVPLSEVATVMQQAIVAAEDTRFFEHGGVDLRSVVRAFVANGRGGTVEQGASTLTMQYVRNVLKTDPDLTEKERQEATQDTATRKLQEMRYAVALERELSKDEILSRYLNIAYFGAGAYGIAAASMRYFGKVPAKLTLAEAALLAGLVQAPDTDSPIDGNKERALERRTYVLDSMVGTGAITAQQAAAAKAEALKLDPTAQPNGCSATAKNGWGFFCDYLRQWWMTQPAFGATPQERERNLQRGGYTVVTSLDPDIQAAAQQQTLKVYGYGNKRAAPMAVVQPGTGRVLAMAVNRHYALKNGTMNQLIAGGGDIDGYQAGSTFKLFTMLAALESGRKLDTAFDAPAKFVSDYPASGPESCNGKWCPSNANPSWMDGRRTMWTGFGRSVNTYFVWLEQQVGADKAVEMAQRLGITFRADSDANFAKDNAAGWGSFTLGVAATTPLDLANAYATVAAEGTYCKPLPVVSITDASGAKVAAGNPSCDRVLTEDIARAATDAARCPVGQQSAFGRCDGGTATQVSTILDGRPVAGKTGSSEDASTETFVGFTPQIAVASIAANPDDPQDHVGSAIQQEVINAVARTMAAALEGQPEKDFTPPSTDIAFSGS
ncbi:transglycosylase domain-containing protein [Phytohabitans rumicis]|uniref:Transglycosylase n=1 Tax=Phytohabitans rumicis TaxID=1076125 RepID=A0A6V8KWA5_9ACTN|nr:transglycosylase domain-containing protein [Phytohabitans rumicis]GFJ89363.1 transglycosylase [Phytohabitans rumicis]